MKDTRAIGKLLFLAVLFSSYNTPYVNAEVQNASDWHFTLTPYVWIAGQEGTVATFPGAPPVDIEVDFWDDILDNLNGAIFVIGEARKDKLGGFLNLAYVDIEDDSGDAQPVFSKIISQTKSWMIDAGGFYRAVESEKWFTDIFVGIRYWSVESSLELQGDSFGSLSTENTESWMDPFVGVKAKTKLGNSKVFIGGIGTIGGFGAGSDFMWDLNIYFGYDWTNKIATTIGYRHLEVDYEDDEFVYDVEQSGPTLGFTWKF